MRHPAAPVLGKKSGGGCKCTEVDSGRRDHEDEPEAMHV